MSSLSGLAPAARSRRPLAEPVQVRMRLSGGREKPQGHPAPIRLVSFVLVAMPAPVHDPGAVGLLEPLALLKRRRPVHSCYPFPLHAALSALDDQRTVDRAAI